MKRPANARRGHHGPSLNLIPPRDAGPPRWLAGASLVALVAVLGVDVFRVGYFADDFHFLDVARRMSIWDVLTGQFGVYPWYRPLSREFFFEVSMLGDRAGPVIGHALSLFCVGISAWQIRQLGARVANARVGAIAALLFLSHSITKFLTAWASGFQDVLAGLLVLLAVRAHLDRRPVLALVLAFLAPFAKETAVMLYPMIALLAAMLPRERGSVRRLLAYGMALTAVVAIHVAVRATWQTAGRDVQIEPSISALLATLVRAGAGIAGAEPSFAPFTIGAALVASVAAAAFMASPGPDHGSRSPGLGAPLLGTARTVTFLASAAALGMAPLLAGNILGLVSAHEYYVFPAAPWLALLLALPLARIPRVVGTLALSALVGWNTLALAYQPRDLSSPDAWNFRHWDWAAAVRLSEVSRRLAEDLRFHLASRPESLVVLYREFPAGTYFQTGNGPATRESLRDPTVRAFWVNEPPYGLRPGGYAILAFDHGTRHLAPFEPGLDELGGLTATALACGNGPSAWAYASYSGSADREAFEFTYYRAAAAILVGDIAGARREFQALGLGDTTGAQAGIWADRVFERSSPMHGPMASMLGRPFDPDAHVAFADAFLARGAPVFEAVELRIATALDPGRVADRLRLARTLLGLGQVEAARADLERLLSGVAGTPAEAETRDILHRLGHPRGQ